jgi:hypothetical protein
MFDWFARFVLIGLFFAGAFLVALICGWMHVPAWIAYPLGIGVGALSAWYGFFGLMRFLDRSGPGLQDTEINPDAIAYNDQERYRFLAIMRNLSNLLLAEETIQANVPPAVPSTAYLPMLDELQGGLRHDDPYLHDLLEAQRFLRRVLKAIREGSQDVNGAPWPEVITQFPSITRQLEQKLPMNDPVLIRVNR